MTQKILIVGDCFIDENWLVAKGNTYTSSHTGDIHYLGKHKKLDKRMISLCGAWEILEVLRLNISDPNKDKYSFICSGAWNKYDNNIIKCSLCPKNPKDKLMSPYTITGLSELKQGEEHLCPYNNLVCDYDPTLINLAKNEETSTNRIIRVYEGSGGGRPHLLYRFDWELPISGLDYSGLTTHLDDDIKVIVIEDHGKGVINKDTIEHLTTALGDNLGQVKWYIRSKAVNPTWMIKLKEKDIISRLKIVDCKFAIHRKGPRRWRFGKELGRASLELLGELTGDQLYNHGKKIEPEVEEKDLITDRVAVLFDDNMAIAKDKRKCFNLYTPPGPKQLINIGRTTIFYSSLIAQDLLDKHMNDDFGTQCRNALQCAFEWSKNASRAWNMEEPHFYGDYSKALDALNNTTYFKEETKFFDYIQLWDNWNKSSTEQGCLVEKGIKKLQVWRGEGAIEG